MAVPAGQSSHAVWANEPCLTVITSILQLAHALTLSLGHPVTHPRSRCGWAGRTNTTTSHMGGFALPIPTPHA
eukprot:6466924-Amphidinium_carterae.1